MDGEELKNIDKIVAERNAQFTKTFKKCNIL